MIGRLTGRLGVKALDHVLIDVGGVGYVVFVSERTLAALPAVGSPVSLHTDLLVREQLLQLFGFTSLVEREWHRLLMDVQGVGAKASLAILGVLGGEGLSRAIALGDAASVARAKGVGPKIAQRVVIELKSKAPAVMAMGGEALAQDGDEVVEAAAPRGASPAVAPAPAPAASADALSALGNLGYAPSDAARAVAEAAGDAPDADAATLIRAALRRLAPA
ncbi:MAG: Holliday junction branch migration protein RuvA [Paracoccaceae bacterium]